MTSTGAHTHSNTPHPSARRLTVRSVCIDHSVDWPHNIDEPARVVDAAASQRHCSPPPPSAHKHVRTHTHLIDSPCILLTFILPPSPSSSSSCVVRLPSFLPSSCSSFLRYPILSQTMCMSHLQSGKDVGFSVEPASGPETFTHCPLVVNMWITLQSLGAPQLPLGVLWHTNLSSSVHCLTIIGQFVSPLQKQQQQKYIKQASNVCYIAHDFFFHSIQEHLSWRLHASLATKKQNLQHCLIFFVDSLTWLCFLVGRALSSHGIVKRGKMSITDALRNPLLIGSSVFSRLKGLV